MATITKENLALLEQYLASELSKEEILEQARELVELQDTRQQAVQSLANAHHTMQQAIYNGDYDDILWDLNAIIDRTQTLMQPKQEETTIESNQEENV